jgi:hypothetical protein
MREASKMILTVGIPSSDTIYVDTALCLNAACLFTLQSQVQINAIVNKKGSIVHQARCDLVKEAQENRATHLLFLDSDHAFPRDTFLRLLKHDKDIVGVHQVTKRQPVRSNCEDLKGQRLTKPGSGLEEVSRLGTGIMLVKMEVFKRLKKPYFTFSYDDNKGWTGEDYWFCKHAKERGFRIYVDHELSKECFHIGTAMYGVQELERNQP